MIFDYLKISINNLKHRGLRTWLTLLGILIGIAAVVSLISLGQGLRTAIVGQFDTLSADILTIQNSGTGFGPPGSTSIKKLNNEDLEIIKKVRGVKEVDPRLIRIVSSEYGDEKKFLYITNLPIESKSIDNFYKSNNLRIEQGRLLRNTDTGKVIIGSDVLNSFEKKIFPGSKIKIQNETFEIIGVLKKSSSFQINSVILINYQELESLLDIKEEYDLITVKVDNKDEVSRISEDIKSRLRENRNLKKGEEDFSVQTPAQTIEGINNILNIVNVIVYGIAFISIVVGGVGITNTMYTSVLERTREIGVMKAIGAKNKDILLIFLIEAGLLGLIGGIIGVITGISLAIALSKLVSLFLGGFDLKISISWTLMGSSILFSFLIGIIAGFVPAYQGSKLKPVDALRQ